MVPFWEAQTPSKIPGGATGDFGGAGRNSKITLFAQKTLFGEEPSFFGAPGASQGRPGVAPEHSEGALTVQTPKLGAKPQKVMTLLGIVHTDPKKVMTLLGLQHVMRSVLKFWLHFPERSAQNSSSELFVCCKPSNVVTFFEPPCAIPNNVITFWRVVCSKHQFW